jgi:hypothetical protein
MRLGPSLAVIALAVFLLQPTGAETGRWFEDVTGQAGVATAHANRVFENDYAHIMSGYTALGAAVAVADFDGDGFDDIFVTDSAADGRNRLYRNNGDFTFTDVAEAAGVAAGNDATNASANALWFDYNNDGRPDLFVVRFGRSQLFENLGDGRFREVTESAGLTAYANAIAAIAFDYNRNGFLDLFIGCYFQPVNIFNPETPRFFPESFETANNGGGVIAYRNNGDGTFTDVTGAIGLSQSGWVLDIGHADANNNGWDDLFVAVDFGTDRYFVNEGGRFVDRSESAIGIDTKKGMNAEWGDYDNDGLLDIYVTNITTDFLREGNFLWRNNGDHTFTDVALETGTWDTGWGWGGKFFDYDNDGWLDLYVLNGWVSAGPDSYVPDIFEMIIQPGIDLADLRNWPPMGNKSLSGYERNRLFHNVDGTRFEDHAARHGLDSIRDGRGMGIADFDNDGRLDIFVANANNLPTLYRNVMPWPGDGAHWIQLVLEGTTSNRGAVGAQVRVQGGGQTYLRFVDGGNSFAGQSSARVHVGLGTAQQVDSVEVRWPSGLRQTFDTIPINRITRIVEGGSPVPFGPALPR